MMGRTQARSGKLFYDGIRLDERVRPDHPLRTIRKLVDFDFAYGEVADCYGYNGNVSVPPPVILKLMFLLFYYDVASERELVATLPERLDWLWFLGYDLDDLLPNYSVLSKARARWGSRIFWRLFDRTIGQCIALGLVDGRDVYCDSSLLDANAANDEIRRGGRLIVLETRYGSRLTETDEAANRPEGERRNPAETAANAAEGPGSIPDQAETASKTGYESKAGIRNKDGAGTKGEVSGRTATGTERSWVSRTDRDAAVVSGQGGSRARYKTHRMIDGRQGVITATEITAGDVNEAHRLRALMDQHEAATGSKILTATADSKYGTIENYLHCHDRNVAAYMPDMKEATRASGHKRGMFPDTDFRYCPEEDVYLCPAGKRLKRRRFHRERSSYEYCGTQALCGRCRLRAQCTTGKNGRSIKRHLRQEELDRMRAEARSWRAQAARRRRQHLMEGSFADGANNLGLKRARWRGLERMAIQDYFIAAIQNIRIMMRALRRRAKAGAGARAAASPTFTDRPTRLPFYIMIMCLVGQTTNEALASPNLSL